PSTLHSFPTRRSSDLDEHTLEAVFQARRDGLISPILVGDAERIRSIARSQGEDVPQEALVQAGGEAECAQCAVDLIRQGRGKLRSEEHTSELQSRFDL